MKVDWHCHWVPPALALALTARVDKPRIEVTGTSRYLRYFESGLPFHVTYEDVPARLALLDASGIDHQVLSLPGLFGIDSLPLAQALPLTRLFNEATAELVAARSERFSGLAALPLADVGTAASELELVLREGGLIGAILPVDAFLTLADAQHWAPVFDVLQRFKAHVFVHPGPLPAGFPSSTEPQTLAPQPKPADNASYRIGAQHIQSRITSAATTLTLTSFLDPYPNVTVQVANLGGTLPFIVERFDAIDIRDAGGPKPRPGLRRIFVDTASLGEGAIGLAAKVFGVDRLLFGTDQPIFDAGLPTRGIERSGLSTAEQALIFSGSALRAHPGLAGESLKDNGPR